MDKQSSQILNPLSDTALDDLLRSVKVEVPLPNTFQAEVWRRIAVAQETSFRVRVSRRLDGIFGVLVRPVAAMAAVLLMITAGAWFGSMGPDIGHEGKLTYVQSVSPFAKSHEEGHR